MSATDRSRPTAQAAPQRTGSAKACILLNMLDETLVAWTGEFGRTPLINKDAGRDHWGRVYSTVLAGGGVRGGQVGRSDAQGAVPADNPVHVSDFVATIYHALGYGAETHVTDPLGRPHHVVQGKPVRELF